MDLSIVIVTFKSSATIEACLNSVLENSKGLETEVWVIDNNSGDGTPRFVSEHFPGVRLIENPVNAGFASGCNLGIRQTTGRNILLLNPDTEVLKDTFQEMVKFLDSSERTGIVGCQQVDKTGKPHLACYPPLSLATVVWTHWQLDKLFPNLVHGKYRQRAEKANTGPLQVGWVSGSCLMFKRAVIEDIGLLDENLFLFAEEPDFCRRAANQGWECWFIPSVKVIHHAGKSTDQVPLLKLSSHYFSKLYFFGKHFSVATLLVVKLIFLLDLLSRMAIRSGQGLAGNAYARNRLKGYFLILKQVLKYRKLTPPVVIKDKFVV